MNNLLLPLQKAQGKVVIPKKKRFCPVHISSVGVMTDWIPASGLDPKMREFQCQVNKHAFYEVMK